MNVGRLKMKHEKIHEARYAVYCLLLPTAYIGLRMHVKRLLKFAFFLICSFTLKAHARTFTNTSLHTYRFWTVISRLYKFH